MRRTLALAAALLLTGCATDSSPTPTPTPTPTPPPEVLASVSGRVWDSIGRSVTGARIEVISGRLAGTFVSSNDDGSYAFPVQLPLFSDIRASKSGYLDSVETLTATKTPLIFRLGSPAPTIILNGQYDVTFEADATCTALPDVTRKRTYLANSVRMVTELSGALFAGGDPPANTMILSQFGEFAKFQLVDPPIWELIPNAGWVMISGEALGVLDPDLSQLLLDGEFKYCSNYSSGLTLSCMVDTVSCRSSQHVMTLKRR
jgi:hypothetical protein